MPKSKRRMTASEKAASARYLAMVNASMPKSKTLRQCVIAFAVGGAICCLGQLVGDIGTLLFDLDEQSRSAFTSMIMIFIGALATGVGVYDKLGAFAGAGDQSGGSPGSERVRVDAASCLAEG